MKTLHILLASVMILGLIAPSEPMMITQEEMEHFYREQKNYGNEMEREIIRDFEREHGKAKISSLPELEEKYTFFKKNWLQRMVEDIITELDINEEGALEARRDPQKFYINYDTYKLLRFL